MTVQNLLDLSESYAVSGIFALGLFVVLVTGGIDISFAAVASVVQYLIATLATHYGLASPAGSILLALAIGAALGMVNALLIYCLRIVSIIVTISMQALLFGMLMWLTNGRSLYALPDWWTLPRSVLPFQLGEQSYQLGLPTLVMLAVALLTAAAEQDAPWAPAVCRRRRCGVGAAHRHPRRPAAPVRLWLGVMAAIGGPVQVYRMGRWCPTRWWAVSSTYWRRRCWAAPA